MRMARSTRGFTPKRGSRFSFGAETQAFERRDARQEQAPQRDDYGHG